MTTTIRDIIAEELLNPTFEMTRQYLKILEVEYEGNKPKIVKIDIQENQSIAYVEVKNESFYQLYDGSTIVVVLVKFYLLNHLRVAGKCFVEPKPNKFSVKEV